MAEVLGPEAKKTLAACANTPAAANIPAGHFYEVMVLAQIAKSLQNIEKLLEQ